MARAPLPAVDQVADAEAIDVVHGIGVLLDIALVPGYRCGDFTPRSVIRYG